MFHALFLDRQTLYLTLYIRILRLRLLCSKNSSLYLKSVIENVEVFLVEARVILELGYSLCSCLGIGPVLQFHCCSAVALCFGRRLAGRRDYSINTLTTCSSEKESAQAFLFKSVLSSAWLEQLASRVTAAECCS